MRMDPRMTRTTSTPMKKSLIQSERRSSVLLGKELHRSFFSAHMKAAATIKERLEDAVSLDAIDYWVLHGTYAKIATKQ